MPTLEHYRMARHLLRATLRVAFDPDQLRDEHGRWVELGESLRDTLNHSGGVFYTTLEDAKALSAKLPGSIVLRKKRGFIVSHVKHGLFGPEGYKTLGMRAAYSEDQPRDEQGRFSGSTLFHGTTSEVLASIKQHGLVPSGGKGADAAAIEAGYTNISEFATADRKGSVFMTPDSRTAMEYGRWAVKARPGSKALVLAVVVPSEHLAVMVPDEYEKMGFRYQGKIPAEWIRTVESDGSLRALEQSTFYVVMLVDDDVKVAGRAWLLHDAADALAPKFSVAVRAAFALGRKQLPNVAKALLGARVALKATLPKLLEKVAVAGGTIAAGQLKVAEFNPDQPRDDHGRWSDGGASGIPSDGRVSQEGLDQRFPRATERVGELMIPDFHDEFGPDVPNMSSISASLGNDYEILPGIREVKISDFENTKISFYSSTEEARVKRLAERLKESGTITPLIVVVDKERYPYILEGGHRFDALLINKVEKFPALVVIDTSELEITGLKVAATKPLIMKFDATNPRIAKWAREHAAELIDGILEVTRQKIENATVLHAEGDLEDDEYANALDAAIGDEARAEVIARTETMTAVHAGQREAWDQAVDEGLLTGTEKRVWIVTEDEKLCPICDALDGETTNLDGEYAPGIEGPPAHPNCRCTEGLQ